MKALVFERPGQASIQEMPYPKPGPGEVTIRVRRVGICGTDHHIFHGEFISPYPIIPGHEFSGIVHELGEGVVHLKPGDRVTADPSLFCGTCEYCMTNRGNQCVSWGALGNTVHGAMAEYVAVPAGNVMVLPDAVTMEEGAFAEPLACVVHAMNRLQLQSGSRVVVFGAGAMGQQLVQALAHSGASELAVVDLSERKLQLAREHGATRGILFDELREEAFDVVVEATGIPQVAERAFGCMGRTAKYLQFGVVPPGSRVTLDPFRLYNEDWTILGSMAINHTFIPAFRWLCSGRFRLQPLVSKVIALEDAPDYFRQPKDKDEYKVQITLE
ncbi:zinc-dependent alcohol dehydrogenase family protein [Paenibacillus piri]|nr:zinc-dependent alcohol dehydrogenase family protein [Paenibacillus piri]